MCWTEKMFKTLEAKREEVRTDSIPFPPLPPPPPALHFRAQANPIKIISGDQEPLKL